MDILVGTRDGLHRTETSRTSFTGHEVQRLALDGDTCWALVDADTIWRGPVDSAS